MDLASAEAPSAKQNVVVILTDTDWTDVKRAASQSLRSPVSSWLVYFVDQSGDTMAGSATGRVRDSAFLAERAGATSAVGDLNKLVVEIEKLAEAPNKILIVQGQGIVGQFNGWLFEQRLMTHARGASIRRVALKNSLSEASLSAPPVKRLSRRTILDLLAVAALVSISAYLSWALHGDTPDGFGMLLMLAGTFVAASVLGRWAGILATTISMLILNITFFEPVGTISIDKVQDILVLLVFLVLGTAMSLLAGRSADRLKIARERQLFSESMFRMARNLAESASLDEISKHLSVELGEALDAKVYLLDCRDSDESLSDRLSVLIGHDVLNDDMRALQFAIDTNEPTGYGTSVANETIFHFQPVSVTRQSLAVIIVSDMDEAKLGDPKLRVLIQSVADLCGIALERLFAEQEIKEAKANETSERLRATVFSSLSHDFRTPLSTIIGSTTSLQQFRGKYDEETVDDLLSNISSAATRLDRFIGEVLELSKLQDEEIISKADPVDLVDIVETVEDTLNSLLSNFRIERKFDHPVPLVVGDPLLLEHMLQNFLENATKYSAAGSTITLSLLKQEDDVLVSVSDNGIGVAKENLGRIFERSYRVSTVSTEDRSAGLGLSICAEIARLHNGRVWAESDGVGKGTTFFFSLPIGNIVKFEPMESIA